MTFYIIYFYSIKKDNFYTFLDVVISESFQVNDLSINLLSYDGTNFNVEKPNSYILQNNTQKLYNFEEISDQIKELIFYMIINNQI